MADVRVWNRGASVVMVEPVSDEAKAWVSENVGLEGWQYLGNSFAVEPRYVDDLIAGMQGDGLEVR